MPAGVQQELSWGRVGLYRTMRLAITGAHLHDGIPHILSDRQANNLPPQIRAYGVAASWQLAGLIGP
jgi:hypothetical protein